MRPLCHCATEWKISSANTWESRVVSAIWQMNIQIEFDVPTDRLNEWNEWNECNEKRKKFSKLDEGSRSNTSLTSIQPHRIPSVITFMFVYDNNHYNACLADCLVGWLVACLLARSPGLARPGTNSLRFNSIQPEQCVCSGYYCAYTSVHCSQFKFNFIFILCKIGMRSLSPTPTFPI